MGTRTLEELAWLSISTKSVFLPARARPADKEIEVVVLLVPPFCEAIEMTIGVLSAESLNKSGVSAIRYEIVKLL